MAETIMPSFSEQNSLATVSADLGSKSSASGVTGNDAFSKINTLNSKFGRKEITVTARNQAVTIDVNRSYMCGDIIVLNVKGHMTSEISTGAFEAFSFTADGLNSNEAEYIFTAATGGAWDVSDGLLYGYMKNKFVQLNKISNGKYFHVNTVAVRLS